MHAQFTALAMLSALASAQGFYVPDPSPSLGNCSSIPFSGTGTFGNQKYQMLVTAAELGSTPGTITGLGFATCGTGVHEYASIQVVMCHTASTGLGVTFAANLAPDAQTVMSAIDYSWHSQLDSWTELGLQTFFAYNGQDNLVIQIVVTGASYIGSGTDNCRRDVGPRLYANGWTGLPPLTGTLQPGALKIEIGMLGARVSKHGRGCVGSNGQAPRLLVSGVPRLGQQITFGLVNAAPSALAFLVSGWETGAPYPIDLAGIGMPSCTQYISLGVTTPLAADALGSGLLPVTVPNVPEFVGMLIYTQWACIDAAANAGGATTSDYARVLVGA